MPLDLEMDRWLFKDDLARGKEVGNEAQPECPKERTGHEEVQI